MTSLRRFIVVAVVLVAAPIAARGAPAGEGELTGEVVAVRQSVATQSEGTFTEIRVRTAQREETWVRLGRSDEMGQRVRAGDHVHARVMAGNGGDPLAVRSLRNQTTGDRMNLRSREGTLLRQRERDRDQAGGQAREQARDQTRDRDRIHQPGGRPGAGGAGGQGAGHRGGRS